MPTLTILDTVAIQKYIFGSNRLKENIGASELVKRATQAWVAEYLPWPHNVAGVTPMGQLQLAHDLHLEKGQVQAEVIYAGGGNTVILFNQEEAAKTFAAQLSKKLITDAPGLELAVVHKTFDWDKTALGGKKTGLMFEAFSALADIKRSQPVHRPLAGLGVTAMCQSTGQVAAATDPDEPDRLISAEVWAKLAMAAEANQILGQAPDGTSYSIPLEFDDMGRSPGESSYIAVVHADGNRMGRRLEKIAAEHPAVTQNRDYLNALRRFSAQVEAASAASFKALGDKIIASIKGFGTDHETIMEAVPLRNHTLPYRPLVFGGDDLTFVCDGRLGLTLTAFYLQTFEDEARRAGLDDVHACAGMAVVKSHYPFARAYQLAKDLCRETKKWVKENKDDFSAMDWHFTPSGVMGHLDFIREREYRTADNKTLLMRPLALHRQAGDWRHWPNFAAVTQAFLKDEWANKRNKVKRLREALRAGETGVRQFVAAYPGPALPVIETAYPTVQQTGWAGDYCAYYDAIEAMEFFVPLYGAEGSLA